MFSFNSNDITYLVLFILLPTEKLNFNFLYLKKAGIGSPENADQLMIALEPEAAAIFCLERNMNDFQAESGSRTLDGILSQINTHYIVVDIGGQ